MFVLASTGICTTTLSPLISCFKQDFLDTTIEADGCARDNCMMGLLYAVCNKLSALCL